MPVTWTLNVDGRLFGPYTTKDMRELHLEGRVVHWSLVGRTGQDQFQSAGEDPELSHLFRDDVLAIDNAEDPILSALKPLANLAATRLDSIPARPPAPPPRTPPLPEPHRFGSQREKGTRGRFIIISDMKSGSITNMEEEIFKLGDSYRFMPQAWVLNSEASLNAIRQALIQKLGKLDTIFVADTARDRAAWFNFGPEADIRVRRMWSHLSNHEGEPTPPSRLKTNTARR